jgi:hypothetical protein
VTRLAHRFVVYMAAVTRFAFTKGGSRALPSYAPSLPQASDQALGRSYDSAQDLTLVPVRFLFENPPEPVKARSVFVASNHGYRPFDRASCATRSGRPSSFEPR